MLSQRKSLVCSDPSKSLYLFFGLKEMNTVTGPQKKSQNGSRSICKRHIELSSCQKFRTSSEARRKVLRTPYTSGFSPINPYNSLDAGRNSRRLSPRAAWSALGYSHHQHTHHELDCYCASCYGRVYHWLAAQNDSRSLPDALRVARRLHLRLRRGNPSKQESRTQVLSAFGDTVPLYFYGESPRVHTRHRKSRILPRTRISPAFSKCEYGSQRDAR